MKQWRWWAQRGAWMTMAWLSIAETTHASELRDWTPRDSMRTRYFMIENKEAGGWGYSVKGEAARFSQDGKRFFFISFHGDMECRCNVAELTVFSTEEVRLKLMGGSPLRAPTPLQVFRFAEATDGAIASAKWLDDSLSILVKAHRESAAGNAYRLSSDTGRMTKLTSVVDGERLGSFDGQGDGKIYIVGKKTPELSDDAPIYAVTTRRVQEYLNGWSAFDFVTRVAYGSGTTWQLKSDFISGQLAPWFSVDGRRAILVRHPHPIPASWSRYEGKTENREEDGSVSTSTKGGAAASAIGQFMWIDLEHQREEPMLNAPTGRLMKAGARVDTQALWSADEHQVVLVNTALPMEGKSNPERASMAYIINYDVETRRWEILEPLVDPSGRTVKDVNWLQQGKEFLVRHELNGQPAPGTIYASRGSHWVARAAEPAVSPPPPKEWITPSDLSVELLQSQNDPPMIVAAARGREIALTAPDPALKGVWIAPTKLFQWRDGTGVRRTSQLTLPRNSPSGGARIPLVVQLPTDECDPDVFRPDAPTVMAAFGAQTLAAQGFAVLCLDMVPDQAIWGTAQELPMFMDWLDSASSALAQAYPIDLNRVGAIGFSHTGYLVRYATTFPNKLRLASAVVLDSASVSFSSFLTAVAADDPVIDRTARKYYGGSFYESKKSWIDSEPSLNVDRVQAPLLFIDNALPLAYVLDTIGAFKVNQKPFDYLMVPAHAHEMKNPRLREAAQEAVVDWMNFWLQNREDNRPDKAERYERWRSQRDLADEKAHAGSQGH